MGTQRYYTEDRFIENITEPFPLRFGSRTSLLRSHPKLAQEWHYKKNHPWGPEDFSSGSGVKVWWQCPKKKKHIWRATIDNRSLEVKASGCPHCYDESCGIDLRQFPKVLKMFDKTRNKGIDPHKLPSSPAIWWRCTAVDKKHRWKSRFNESVVSNFCPVCRGRRAAPDNNLSNFPKLRKEFHPTKNLPLRARDLVPGSKRNIWWKCDRAADHVWQARVKDRTSRNHGCPFCSNLQLCKSNSLQKQYPNLAKEWHKSKNGSLQSSHVLPNSKRVVWWKCSEGDDHVYQAKILTRTKGCENCPYCKNRASSSTNSLASVYPDLAKEFDEVKNAPLKAKDVVSTSAKKYWWKCKLGHSWKRELHCRTLRQSSCPECPLYRIQRNTKTPVSDYKDLKRHWHPTKNGDLKPEMISAFSKRKVFWQCSLNGDHVWDMWIDHIRKKGYFCPFCEGFRLAKSNCLKALYPKLAEEWHKKNKKGPESFLPGSAYKAWWKCGKCNKVWERECYLRTNRRSACPNCKHYPEQG